MRLFEFYGSSDDNFIVSVNGRGIEEVGCYEKDGVYKLVTPDIRGIYVIGRYAPEIVNVGCWSIGVCPLDEDFDIPAWTVRPFRNKDYSTVLGIECPDDVELWQVVDHNWEQITIPATAEAQP